MKVNIRKYNSNDHYACSIAFESNVPEYFTEDETADFESFLNRVDTGNAANTNFFVVEVNGQVIGCGGFGDRYNNNQISLAWGFIHKNYHKQGLGKLLLEYRLREIEKRYSGAPVSIDTTQHTYLFFQRAGFETTNVTKDYYAPGMDRYDMIFRKGGSVKKEDSASD